MWIRPRSCMNLCMIRIIKLRSLPDQGDLERLWWWEGLRQSNKTDYRWKVCWRYLRLWTDTMLWSGILSKTSESETLKTINPWFIEHLHHRRRRLIKIIRPRLFLSINRRKRHNKNEISSCFIHNECIFHCKNAALPWNRCRSSSTGFMGHTYIFNCVFSFQKKVCQIKIV